MYGAAWSAVLHSAGNGAPAHEPEFGMIALMMEASREPTFDFGAGEGAAEEDAGFTGEGVGVRAMLDEAADDTTGTGTTGVVGAASGVLAATCEVMNVVGEDAGAAGVGDDTNTGAADEAAVEDAAGTLGTWPAD